MFSKNMQKLYKRWLILGLLLMCLGVFGLSDINQTTLATNAPCKQQCEDSQAQCFDSCQPNCNPDSTDQACTDCHFNCENNYFNCMYFAIYCGNSPAYSPDCSFSYGTHCPVVSGTPDCRPSETHSGYYMNCTTIGSQPCEECPADEYCEDSPTQNPC